ARSWRKRPCAWPRISCRYRRSLLPRGRWKVSKLSDRRKEIREYTTEQADEELQRLRRQLFDLRIQQQRGEVKNNRQFTQVRTDIARLMYQLDLLALAGEEELLAEAEEGMEKVIYDVKKKLADE